MLVLPLQLVLVLFLSLRWSFVLRSPTADHVTGHSENAMVECLSNSQKQEKTQIETIEKEPIRNVAQIKQGKKNINDKKPSKQRTTMEKCRSKRSKCSKCGKKIKTKKQLAPTSWQVCPDRFQTKGTRKEIVKWPQLYNMFLPVL